MIDRAREREFSKKTEGNQIFLAKSKQCRFDKQNGIVLNIQTKISELLKRRRFYVKRRRFNNSRDTSGNSTPEDLYPC